MNNNDSEFSSYMNKFLKSILALGITSALGISAVNAATYQVIDKGDVPTLKYTYSQQENNNGEAAISGTNFYNFPVQFQYFVEKDYDAIVKLADTTHERVHELSNIEDEPKLRAGTPTANDLSWVIRFLSGRGNSHLYQKVSNRFALTNFNDDTKLLNVFDEKFNGTETYTRSTTDRISGITNEGWVYGSASAPYLPFPYTIKTKTSTNEVGDVVQHWRRSFLSRGFFSSDAGKTIIPIIPPSETTLPEEQRFGGISFIFDISESHIAVGSASTSIDKDATDFIFKTSGGCKDQKYIDDRNLTFEDCVQSRLVNSYNTEALKWTIDTNGIITTEKLGHLVTPHVDDKREYANFAQAVNSNGVAVGYAHGWVNDDVTSPDEREIRNFYAVVYKNGKVTDFTDDHRKYFDSRAFDINDAGIAVGHVNTFVNGSQRTKFYYVDTTVDDMKMVMPSDFFSGSASTARAINEKGMIVGEGEFETHNDSTANPRRKHGFLYDITTKKFTDLNKFLTCKSGYTIIEARDINDANEISATALVKAPRRDSRGNLMKDASGKQLVEDVVRAVTLKPIGGKVEDCSEVEKKVERQGAGFGLTSLLLLAFVGLRRRFS